MIVIYCSAPIERADSAIQSLSDRYEYIISYIYKSDQRWSFFVCLWSKGIKGVGGLPFAAGYLQLRNPLTLLRNFYGILTLSRNSLLQEASNICLKQAVLTLLGNPTKNQGFVGLPENVSGTDAVNASLF